MSLSVNLGLEPQTFPLPVLMSTSLQPPPQAGIEALLVHREGFSGGSASTHPYQILGKASTLSPSCKSLIVLTHLQESWELNWCVFLLKGNQECWVFVLAHFGANVLILQGTEH